jgi:hypothetical protein
MSPRALAVRLQPLGFDEGHISSVMAAVKAMAQSDGGLCRQGRQSRGFLAPLAAPLELLRVSLIKRCSGNRFITSVGTPLTLGPRGPQVGRGEVRGQPVPPVRVEAERDERADVAHE